MNTIFDDLARDIARGTSSGTTCASGGMVNPSASCTLYVTFTPESKGWFSGQVTITDNAFFSPQVITLAGRGD